MKDTGCSRAKVFLPIVSSISSGISSCPSLTSGGGKGSTTEIFRGFLNSSVAPLSLVLFVTRWTRNWWVIFGFLSFIRIIETRAAVFAFISASFGYFAASAPTAADEFSIVYPGYFFLNQI